MPAPTSHFRPVVFQPICTFSRGNRVRFGVGSVAALLLSILPAAVVVLLLAEAGRPPSAGGTGQEEACEKGSTLAPDDLPPVLLGVDCENSFIEPLPPFMVNDVLDTLDESPPNEVEVVLLLVADSFGGIVAFRTMSSSREAAVRRNACCCCCLWAIWALVADPVVPFTVTPEDPPPAAPYVRPFVVPPLLPPVECNASRIAALTSDGVESHTIWIGIAVTCL
uniref:Uncharacterized protein n=1 Tax=Anopheles farauti TaxID=69004 RepID=A0A182QV40_9DIPT